MATPPVSGPSAATTANATKSADSSFKASSQLQDGKFKLDFENEPVAKSYQAFIGGLGESSAKGVSSRVESKMTDWIKAHPTADKAAFDTQLRSTLMNESMLQNQVKNSLQKGMGDIMAKMQELTSDRFSDF